LVLGVWEGCRSRGSGCRDCEAVGEDETGIDVLEVVSAGVGVIIGGIVRFVGGGGFRLVIVDWIFVGGVLVEEGGMWDASGFTV
jgi:hypothetical protein